LFLCSTFKYINWQRFWSKYGCFAWKFFDNHTYWTYQTLSLKYESSIVLDGWILKSPTKFFPLSSCWLLHSFGDAFVFIK
jgi:hypothetical protein